MWNLSQIKPIWYQTLLILYLSDSEFSDLEPMYLIPNLSDSQSIWFRTYLILILSDSQIYLIPDLSVPNQSKAEASWNWTHQISFWTFWFQTYMIPNYLVLNLADSEHIWFWIYLITSLSKSHLSNSESGWNWTNQISNRRPLCIAPVSPFSFHPEMNANPF
jgi:hypothetical protein